MGFFWAKYILFELKILRSYLSWHWRGMQNLEKNWLVAWKMTWEILQVFTRALESIKIGIWEDTFVQSRKWMSFKFTVELYVSWQWRMIQKLKSNWLVVLKLTWTSQNLTRALEKTKSLFFFNWLLLTKVYIVWATKV